MTKTLSFTTALATGLILLTSLASTSASASRLHPRTSKAYRVGSGGHARKVSYGVGNGGQTPRTTASGGNAGGYTSRN